MLTLKEPSLLRSQIFIGGIWLDHDGANTIEVRSPSDGSLVGTVPCAGREETRQAIEVAEAAFTNWSQATADHRARVLRRWYELMLVHLDDLAAIMTAEQGKPLAESKGEIGYAASYIEWFSEEAKRTYGDLVPSPWADKQILVKREPVGVCAAITPWNFPAAMITRKAAPALAAGCTIIIKPAEQTPLSALALAALAERAGVPPGVLNIVTGKAREIGAELTSSPVVRKLSFTGSTEVGRLLAAQCAPTLKRLSLELGGNAPFIVFDDADVDAAVEGAIGQTCVCANRLLVQEGIHDAFVKKLSAAVRAMKVGDGREPDVQQGPLIDQTALDKVVALLDDAAGKGATITAGGARHQLGGTFFEPTVVAGVTPQMRIANEEIFGPVAPIIRFRTEQEAISIANASEFGLASYFYSRDIARVWRVANAMQAGMVGINTGIISTAVAPFGGVKQSGMGREGSRLGIDEYMHTKYMCMGGI